MPIILVSPVFPAGTWAWPTRNLDQGGGGRMRIIPRRPLRECATKHADAAEPVSAWFQIMEGRKYEDRVYPMDSVSPQQAVAFMLEQKGMTRSDLNDLMGGSSRVSEFFSGKRDLSKQVESLRRHLGIPADVLMGLADDAGPVDRKHGA